MYDEATNTVTYVNELTTPRLLGYLYESDTAIPSLKLYFPGVNVNLSATFTNTAEITSVPYKKGEKEDIQVVKDDIKFKLMASPKYQPGNIGVTKYSTLSSAYPKTAFDVLDTKKRHEYRWDIRVTNSSNGTSNGIPYETTDLENVQIDDNGLDDNLYSSRLVIPAKSQTQVEGSFSLEVTFANGSNQMVYDNLCLTSKQNIDLTSIVGEGNF